MSHLTQTSAHAPHLNRCMDCRHGEGPLCDDCRSDRALEAQVLRACLLRISDDAQEQRRIRRRLERLEW